MGFTAFVAITSLYSNQQQKRAAGRQQRAAEKQFKEQKTQNRERKKIADIKAQRERRSIVKEQRIARSKVNVASEGQSSSRSEGVGGSIATQGASVGSFLGAQIQANQSIFESGQRQADASVELASAQAAGQKAAAQGALIGSIFSSYSKRNP